MLAPDEAARALISLGRPWTVLGPGLWVPLAARGEGLGLAQLSGGMVGFSEHTVEALGALAAVGAATLLSARRFRALQRLALRDPDSSAYNLAYFTDYATKEIDKARRSVNPSTREWFGVAYNYALYANDGGQYDELLAYIRSHKLM